MRAQQGFAVKTDKNGKWMAAWIRSGGWTVTFEKIGYAPEHHRQCPGDREKSGRHGHHGQGRRPGPDRRDQGPPHPGQRGLRTEEIRRSPGQLRAGSIAKYPDAYIIYGNIGNCYFSQEKYDQAEVAYLKVLEKAPGDTNAIIAIGNCYSN